MCRAIQILVIVSFAFVCHVLSGGHNAEGKNSVHHKHKELKRLNPVFRFVYSMHDASAAEIPPSQRLKVAKVAEPPPNPTPTLVVGLSVIFNKLPTLIWRNFAPP